MLYVYEYDIILEGHGSIFEGLAQFTRIQIQHLQQNKLKQVYG